MSNQAKICFDVVGSFTQEIEIVKEDSTVEEIVEKLEHGEYMTTLEVNNPDNQRTIVGFDDDGNEFIVANIISQIAGEENVYSHFQVDE